MRPSRSPVIGTVTVIALAGIVRQPVAAAELQARTSLAYDAYLVEARRGFVSRPRPIVAPMPPSGVLSAGPARDDGIIGVPGGLVHHWRAAAFVRGATLRQGLDVSSAFADYHAVYKAVIRSRLLWRNGDTYSVLMRLEEGEAGVRAVLDVRSTVEYVYPSSDVALALSHADEIREVQHAGRRDERQLPPGRDSGYLWRAATLTYFREQSDGLYVETETIGLSREFPPLLGWIIEPIARRLGRRSAASSLQEFVAVVQKDALEKNDVDRVMKVGRFCRESHTRAQGRSSCDPVCSRLGSTGWRLPPGASARRAGGRPTGRGQPA